MKEQLQKITSETLIPLGAVFALVAILRWVDHVAFVTDANAVAITQFQESQLEISRAIGEIKTDLAVIKSRLPEKKHESR